MSLLNILRQAVPSFSRTSASSQPQGEEIEPGIYFQVLNTKKVFRLVPPKGSDSATFVELKGNQKKLVLDFLTQPQKPKTDNSPNVSLKQYEVTLPSIKQNKLTVKSLNSALKKMEKASGSTASLNALFDQNTGTESHETIFRNFFRMLDTSAQVTETRKKEAELKEKMTEAHKAAMKPLSTDEATDYLNSGKNATIDELPPE